jgi:hypothetical protein
MDERHAKEFLKNDYQVHSSPPFNRMMNQYKKLRKRTKGKLCK